MVYLSITAIQAKNITEYIIAARVWLLISSKPQLVMVEKKFMNDIKYASFSYDLRLMSVLFGLM
jgi:hypothetical protein